MHTQAFSYRLSLQRDENVPPHLVDQDRGSSGQLLTQERTVGSVRIRTWVSLPPKPRPLPEADLLLCAWLEPSPAGQAHPVGPSAPLQGVLAFAWQLTIAPSLEYCISRDFQTIWPKSIKSIAPGP